MLFFLILTKIRGFVNACPWLTPPPEWCIITLFPCGYGEIGKHAGFRYQCFRLWVRVPLPVPYYRNTLDAVGQTPTASSVSGVFESRISSLKQKIFSLLSERLRGLEPSDHANINSINLCALFETVTFKKGTVLFSATNLIR